MRVSAIPQGCVRNPGTRTGLGGGVLGSVIVESTPRPGYYPDPSVPGYIRYWDGSKWVPGTSKPMPKKAVPAANPKAAEKPHKKDAVAATSAKKPAPAPAKKPVKKGH